MLQRIDHLVAPVPSLDAAEAYERLGLALTPRTVHTGRGTANRAAFVGRSAADFVYLELLAVEAPAELPASRAVYADIAAHGGGLAAIAFTVDRPLEAALAPLASAGAAIDRAGVRAEDGRLLVDAALAAGLPAIPFPVLLVDYPGGLEARFERSRGLGRFDHRFPLARLDHLAVLAPDLDAATRAWVDLLGLVVAGEITAPGMVIRQLRCGDAVIELLAPAGDASPLAGRPAALLPVAAWEVAGPLEAAADLARERGFTCPPPSPGVIPGTRRTTIPAAELGGVAMQLLDYAG